MKRKIKFMSETSNQYLSWTIPESFQKIPVYRMGLRPRLIALPPLQATLESQCLNQSRQTQQITRTEVQFLKVPSGKHRKKKHMENHHF